jgi:hypothetical protein
MNTSERSNYQKKVIQNYYANRDTIMLQKISELVTELYLADSEKKKERLWKRAEDAMVNLKVKPAIMNHILEKKDVQVLAKNLEDWLKQK